MTVLPKLTCVFQTFKMFPSGHITMCFLKAVFSKKLPKVS